MGNKITVFTEEQLEAYQDCTFFTRKDILRIFKIYRHLAPDKVPSDMKDGRAKKIKIPYSILEDMNELRLTFLKGGRAKKIKILYSILEDMNELRENPFCERICQVFSEDGSGDLSFDDFLDMFSVFSEAAPRDIKSLYAFKIYDFDGDNFLNKTDLERTIRCLTNGELTQEEISFVVHKVLEESDLDDDSMLSIIEFEHVVSRSPDFLNTFHIRI